MCKFVRACVVDADGLFIIASKDTQIIAFAYGRIVRQGRGGEAEIAAEMPVADAPGAAVTMAWANVCYRKCGVALVDSLHTSLTSAAARGV